MTLALIVAMAENRVIGREGTLPWHLPNDLKRFKALTTGHTLIMGRRTHESIGRPLPKRRTIVLSRQPDYQAEGVEVAADLETALRLAAGDELVFVVGGADVFRAALPLAERLYLTLVHADVPGDVLLPELHLDQWRTTHEEHHASDERHAFAYSFVDYERC